MLKKRIIDHAVDIFTDFSDVKETWRNHDRFLLGRRFLIGQENWNESTEATGKREDPDCEHVDGHG